jgi:hypothetical protein
MTNQTSPDEAVAAQPLLPRHFQRSAFLVGAAYMLLMFGASEFLGNELPLRLWWWTALPVAGLGAIALHWRHWRAMPSLRERLVEQVRRHPGYAVFLSGMAVVVETFVIRSPPVDGGDPSSGLFGYNLATGVIIIAALAVSFLARRNRKA